MNEEVPHMGAISAIQWQNIVALIYVSSLPTLYKGQTAIFLTHFEQHF